MCCRILMFTWAFGSLVGFISTIILKTYGVDRPKLRLLDSKS